MSGPGEGSRTPADLLFWNPLRDARCVGQRLCMSLRHALLGILADGPRHGWALRSALAERIGSFWPVHHGQVYATLERLQRDGLVSCGPPDHRDRRSFSIRPEGRRELEHWLAEPGRSGAGDGLGFDDWLARVAACVHLGEIELARHAVELQRNRYTTLRAGLAGDRPTTPLRAARALLQAELDWLDEIEEELSTARREFA